MELDTVVGFVLVFSCSCLTLLASEDSIKVGKSITGNQKMVSTGGTFALGFFTPGNSTFSYIGIWYNTIPELTVIWVANRESPISENSTAVFTIGDDGNLVVFDENGKLIWSSNVSSTTGLASNSAVGALLDNGNLVLMHGESHILWQSFEHPTDTFMHEMTLGYNRTTSQRTLINSWTSSEDPRPGNFSFGVDPQGRPQFYIWKQNSIYYRFDDSNEYAGGRSFLGIAWYLSVASRKDGVFLTYGYTKSLITIIVVLKPSGYLQVLAWIQYANKWKVEFQAPQVPWEHYAQCGPFGSCGIRTSGLCKCLTGFEPRFSTDWENGKSNGGCARKLALACDGGDGFLKHENMKLPDHAISLSNMSIMECETQCIRNCSCSAYAYPNSTCLIWFGDLLDLAHNYTAGRALYVRVRGSEPVTRHVSGNSARRHIIFIASIVSTISAILVLISIFAFVSKRKHLRRQGWKN